MGGQLESSTSGNGCSNDQTNDCWKQVREFRVGDLFNVDSWQYGKNKQYKTKFDTPTQKSIPVISGVTINNGVNYYTEDELEENEIWNDCLTITTRGEYSGSVFYQDYPFALANNILVMPIPGLSQNMKLYIATALQKLPFGGYGNYPTKDKLAKSAIALPIQTDSSNHPVIDPTHKYHPEGFVPDWEYMEKYIRAMEKVVIRDVVVWKDEMIEKTKMVVNG